MVAEVDIDQLLAEYLVTRDRKTRNRIVVENFTLVDHYVRRFSRSSRVSADDLRQVALIALIGAVDRYDPAFGASITTFASRTIEGELKRHMRDRSWLVRPPRSYQDAHLQIGRATEELAQKLGRNPSVPELARHLSLDEKRIRHGLDVARVRGYESLTRYSSSADTAIAASEPGSADSGFKLAEVRMTLRSEISHLSEREQAVLRMRFLEELSQIEIAQVIGVSQSYVSRVMRAALHRLRSAASIRDLESVDLAPN